MIACVIILIVGAVLLFPIPCTVMGHVSVVPRTYGGVSVRVFGKSVFAARVRIRAGKIFFSTAKGKTKQAVLSSDRNDPNSLASYLDNGILRVLDLRDLELYVTAGVGNDAMATALTVAGFSSAFGAAAGFLRSHVTGLTYRDYYEPIYDEDRLTLTIRVKTSVSPADLIYALIYAAVKKLRKRREYVFERKYA